MMKRALQEKAQQRFTLELTHDEALGKQTMHWTPNTYVTQLELWQFDPSTIHQQQEACIVHKSSLFLKEVEYCADTRMSSGNSSLGTVWLSMHCKQAQQAHAV
jgi:hypothetical protein